MGSERSGGNGVGAQDAAVAPGTGMGTAASFPRPSPSWQPLLCPTQPPRTRGAVGLSAGGPIPIPSGCAAQPPPSPGCGCRGEGSSRPGGGGGAHVSGEQHGSSLRRSPPPKLKSTHPPTQHLTPPCPTQALPGEVSPQDGYVLLLALLSIFIGGTLVLLSGILIVCRRCCEADRRHSRWVGRAVLCPQGWWHRVVLLRFAMARGCSDRPSPRRASDDPEKTTTTYLDDSQPAQGERWGSLPTCDAASWGGGDGGSGSWAAPYSWC